MDGIGFENASPFHELEHVQMEDPAAFEQACPHAASPGIAGSMSDAHVESTPEFRFSRVLVRQSPQPVVIAGA